MKETNIIQRETFNLASQRQRCWQAAQFSPLGAKSGD